MRRSADLQSLEAPARISFAGAGNGFERPEAGELDVTRVSARRLAAWRAGGLCAQQHAATVERARSAYARLLDMGARVLVARVGSNGGCPAVLLVPPGFQPASPHRVHVHFHGWNSSAAEPEGHPAGVSKAIARRFDRDARTVYVLPECENIPLNARPVWAGVQSVTVETSWANVESTSGTADELLAMAFGAAPRASSVEHVLSAHSGGGRALGYAMQRRPRGDGLRADRVELYDCLYGAPYGALSARQALKAWLRTPSGTAVRAVAYFEGNGGNGEKPDGELLRLLGPRFFHARGYSHNACIAENFANG